MSKFNKLYNLILQSIITEDINSKIKKAIDTLIKSGQLQNENDPRAQQVKTIIKRNNSIDINGKTKLDQLLKANQTLLNRAESKKDSYLDNISEFSQKKEYPNGVVIYRVEDSKEGMNAVRKIIDIQWGEDAKPWCLITRPMEQAWDYWNEYNSYPKHIAFQNGKLLAFCANEQNQNLWWDRENKSSKELKLLNGKKITTDNYKWSKEDILKILSKNKLVLNKETGLYDSNSDIEITDKDLICGKLPVKFGKVKGSFYCCNCNNLISLQGAPNYVGRDFDCSKCNKLTNLEGSPEEVGRDFYCRYCLNLKSLKGAPKKVNEHFYCYDCNSLTSLKGAPKYVGRNFDCEDCENLTSLQGAPEYVGGNFNCWGCKKLKITKEDKRKYRIVGIK